MPNSITLQSPITAVPLVGPAQAQKLEKLGIFTVRDLLYHFPVRYRDTSQLDKIMDLFMKREGTIVGFVDEIESVYTRSRKVITKASVSDDTGRISIVWFNQRFITNAIKKGDTFIFELKLPDKPGAKDYYCLDYEKLYDDKEQVHLGRVTPFYDQTAGVSSKWLRARLIWLRDQNIDIPSSLDEELGKLGYLSAKDALYKIHFPENFNDVELARKRLGFEEMLEVALKLERKVSERTKLKAPEIKVSSKKLREFLSMLKFELTADQQNSLNEILEDISGNKPMHRLLNGDVGSGKTIVAAAAAYMAAYSGYSTLVMAPTTILSQQHVRSFEKLFEPFDIKVDSLISGELLEPSMKPQVIIGTHALLYEEYLPKNIGLVIVDEQHRFGVKQREQLLEGNKNVSPHYLTMTATPIPRTLTHILYGDMDLSIIKQMPKNRIPIESHLVPDHKIEDGYKWIKDMIVKSNYIEQAYIVFPLIEESEKSDLKAATKAHEELSAGVFKDLKVGLLHGRMKDREKDEILMKFKNKEYHVLISTTVIEVGIDVPDATIMVIENAERFGLAQLHQLRGRVGRGSKKSYCFVIPSKEVLQESKGYERLKYFCEHPSGFDVAEYDLKTRGPGEVYGDKQSGIPDLRIADITDIELLQACRKFAREIL